ncbi:acyl-CoA dehydrogenase family protein [Rhodoferax sp. UBA5149]|uniref:acyl-CoA dehydrogenase family protein n=1 Tax=Rhodoferax sp. UBA5149 TaxID=1947379 RepID=UPI0025F47155|nr:acyl-CoA dehydrogenase [Rhodoferax sp. UBA5149]
MDFEYNEEQQLLADSVSKYLAKAYDFESRKQAINSSAGFSEAAWSTFAEMGLTAIPFAQADGGFGGGAVDMMAAMEAFGEALVIEPLLDHIALATRLVAHAGSEAQRAAVLPALIDGSRKATFAYLERGQRYALDPTTTSATRSGAQWKLDGEKMVVIGAPLADVLVVSARTGGGASLFLVDRTAPGVSVSAYRTVDGQRAGDVTLTGVMVGADALLGGEGSALPWIEEAVDFATALLCAEAVGAMKSATDATLDYLKTRKQFGAPIGAFQALQHRMVDMYIAGEQARSMAILAACRVDAAASSLEPAAAATRKAAISSAKVSIADAARLISQESVQLHGGMGMTEEMKVSHTFRRLTVLTQRFGDADHHLERYAALT